MPRAWVSHAWCRAAHERMRHCNHTPGRCVVLPRLCEAPGHRPHVGRRRGARIWGANWMALSLPPSIHSSVRSHTYVSLPSRPLPHTPALPA
eukprot:306866-Chlamydomonas_euryale.AAC.1